MSEYVRYDSATFTGSASSATTVIPGVNNLSRDGYQALNSRHFNTLSVQLSGTWVGTVVVEQSNDAVNWVASALLSSATATMSLSTTTTGIFTVSINAKYSRVRCSAYTSGTIVCVVNLSTTLASPLVATQTVSTTGSSVTPAPTPSTGSGSYGHIISTASTNATSVKATQGVVNVIAASNNGAAVAYLKLYDKASAPTVGTDVPVATIMLPVGGTIVLSGGYVAMRFPNGIAYAITAGAAVADTTAVAAAQVVGTVNYT